MKIYSLFFNENPTWKTVFKFLARVAENVLVFYQWFIFMIIFDGSGYSQDELRGIALLSGLVFLMGTVILFADRNDPKIRLFSLANLLFITFLWSIMLEYPFGTVEFSASSVLSYLCTGSVIFCLVLYIIEAVRCIKQRISLKRN